MTKKNQDYSSLQLVILPWNTPPPFIFKGCFGKTLFIIVIIPYKKLPKNTMHLNYLLFLTYGVNKEIKKYILIRRYNTINESLLKTNLLKCCWSQRAELEYSFKYNYELVKWWKHDPPLRRTWRMPRPPRAVPGMKTHGFTASWKTNHHSSRSHSVDRAC